MRKKRKRKKKRRKNKNKSQKFVSGITSSKHLFESSTIASIRNATTSPPVHASTAFQHLTVNEVAEGEITKHYIHSTSTTYKPNIYITGVHDEITPERRAFDMSTMADVGDIEDVTDLNHLSIDTSAKTTVTNTPKSYTLEDAKFSSIDYLVTTTKSIPSNIFTDNNVQKNETRATLPLDDNVSVTYVTDNNDATRTNSVIRGSSTNKKSLSFSTGIPPYSKTEREVSSGMDINTEFDKQITSTETNENDTISIIPIKKRFSVNETTSFSSYTYDHTTKEASPINEKTLKTDQSQSRKTTHIGKTQTITFAAGFRGPISTLTPVESNKHEISDFESSEAISYKYEAGYRDLFSTLATVVNNEDYNKDSGSSQGVSNKYEGRNNASYKGIVSWINHA